MFLREENIKDVVLNSEIFIALTTDEHAPNNTDCRTMYFFPENVVVGKQTLP